MLLKSARFSLNLEILSRRLCPQRRTSTITAHLKRLKKILVNGEYFFQAQEAKIIPSIPALPISYAAAKEILSHLTGGRAADSFQGDFNLTYNTGPGFDNGGSLTFEVHNNYENK